MYCHSFLQLPGICDPMSWVGRIIQPLSHLRGFRLRTESRSAARTQRGFCTLANRMVSARFGTRWRTGNGTNSARPHLENCAVAEIGRSKSTVQGRAENKSERLILKKMAPQAGFEPATLRLTAITAPRRPRR